MSAESGSGRAAGSSPLTTRFAIPSPIDLAPTMAPLSHGRGDPTIRIGTGEVWLARATAEGPASLHLAARPGEIAAEAWGPGAAAALEAAPGLAGILDDPSPLVPHHRLVGELIRRLPGLRLPRTGQLVPALIPAVMEQKVTGMEAKAAYRAMVRRFGEPAPGPVPLILPPPAERLATIPYFELHPLGLERRRAELLARIGGHGPRIESWLALPAAEAREKLQAISGIGPWTAAEATRAAFGDPDAVSVGDAHLPDLVAWALAGEARADDARMLELLAPYAGQRGRVVRLLEASGIKIPRFGPRYAPRRIAGI